MKETLEETAKRIYGSDSSKDIEYYAFINGAKWQQQNSYSEEDLKEAFKSCYTPFSFDRIGDLEQDFNKWFEQFKKK